jgi:hypothetical protein
MIIGFLIEGFISFIFLNDLQHKIRNNIPDKTKKIAYSQKNTYKHLAVM